VALNQFDAALKKHRLDAALKKDSLAPKDLHSRDFYESIQIRRAFILADLGRWKEALPILEGLTSTQEYKEGIAFYLGHCYVESGDYYRAEEKLTEALKLGLPSHLEYCAHCELGTTYYHLENYSRAKEEFERGAKQADATYIKKSQVWKWLEMTCRALGLKAEAEQYARMANPS
jgi:tetratricopeptide (TPR) repeat protein